MNLRLTLPARGRALWIFVWGIGALYLSAVASAQYTQRVSVSSSGAQASGYSDQFSLSGDGRFVCFSSAASNLVPGDANDFPDVFLRDRLLGTTIWLSSGIGGVPGDGPSWNPTISPDGRFVVFDSYSTNLVTGDTDDVPDVFLWDRQVGTLEPISLPTGGADLVGGQVPSITPDGRYVAFTSRSSQLAPVDTNGKQDVFVRDRQLGTTERINLGAGGVQGDADVYFGWPSISADGRLVVFTSTATNMVPGDTNGVGDVFLRDRLLVTTEMMSVDVAGNLGNGHCSLSVLSADGRFVLFESEGSNLVAGDTNGVQDVFLRDRVLGTVDRIDLDSGGLEANGFCSLGYYPQISVDGRFVAFSGSASNLVPGDTNGEYDAFLRDRMTGSTERLSVSSAGVEGDRPSYAPAVSSDGRLACFVSYATNLVAGDTNDVYDIFVRDRFLTTEFTNLCDPGLDGVIACPCANPPGGPGAGCNNAAGTGGASLTSSGVAYLSSDSLVFHTTGEKPTALSVLLQGTSLNASGVIYGQGVRCVGGILKRLYSKNAVLGSITVPNFAAGEPSVSARSAAKGNVISAGQSRWYLVFYRDPVVLGGCPTTSTFNATQTGRIDWSL